MFLALAIACGPIAEPDLSSIQSVPLVPFGRSVMTSTYGVVVFVACDGEPVDPESLLASHADVPTSADGVWSQWRPATLAELVKTWPSRPGSKIDDGIWATSCGWQERPPEAGSGDVLALAPNGAC